jgi:hypothetical protein
MPPRRGRTVKPENVKTLRDWATQWPTASNVGFDPVTREPTVFSLDGTTQVSKIPWRREADVVSVLSDPARFPPALVSAADGRIKKLKEQDNAVAAAATEQLRIAEADLVQAWRSYRDADDTMKATLRRDILTAERRIVETEEAAAMQLKKGREIRRFTAHEITSPLKQFITTGYGIAAKDIELTVAYIPYPPVNRRGINLVDAAASTAAPASASAPA